MSGTTANLDNTKESVDTSNDGIVIIANLETIPGGKTLDVTGFTPNVIKAGHLVIKETATGKFKPMPVTDTAYDSLPVNHTYEGVVTGSILKTKPFAGVLVRGSVNKTASPYPVSPEAEKFLPLIRFTKD